MPPDAYRIQVTDSKLYWTGYDHGIQGMPRRNLYAGSQSGTYDQGYYEGLEVYQDKRSGRASDAVVVPRNLINKVLSMRDEIDEHHRAIDDLELQIRHLESE